MEGMKQAMLNDMGFTDKGWQTDIGGTLICPHGNRCEDDLAEHGDCGCKSPLRQMGMI